jgi:hypothetical protein
MAELCAEPSERELLYRVFYCGVEACLDALGPQPDSAAITRLFIEAIAAQLHNPREEH